MKFKCLVLDHDDTVVNSTATIHYPCFVEYLAERKPHLSGKFDLDTFFRKNFDPGVLEFFANDVGLTEREMEEEEYYWRDFVKNHVPAVYPGMREIMERFLAEGGILAVASHSLSCYIERDYKENGLPQPSVIYGWEMPKEKRKPAPFALNDLCERFGLLPEEILMVDDLKPGFDMARAAGVPFAAAGWAHNIEEIATFMRRHCDYYLSDTAALSALLFAES
ncbi:MAG: HAD family hydrolase [Clostridia bacterium]|nr:HAD family hydrolase [Clostridia bacterium]